MLKNTLKKLSSSDQAKVNRNPSNKDSKSTKKSKKKTKPKKGEEEEFDMEDESNFEDEEFDDDEKFEEDEEFGDELEDALDDELDDDESSSGKIAEMETRVKDVENEVGQVSSKLNTIRAENEEIGNKINEMEENIRKLLGIYEMVTEGINPFATETGYGGSEGLGIFSSASKESKQEDVPEDLTSKDAESFFEDVDDEEEPEMESEPESLEGDLTSGKKTEGSGSASGESPEDMFERLKEENEGEQISSNEGKGAGPEEIDFEEPELVDEWSEHESEDGSTVEVEGHVHPSETSENVQDAVYQTRAHAGKLPKSSSSPYLKDIPKDLISDVIALKWMDYLVNTFGIKRMADILDFYVDIGWISKNVKDLLINYSRGYVLREGHMIEEPETPTLRDHFKSLIFISKLSGHDLDLEEVEKLVKDVEELEKDVNDVITEHAFGSNC
ncbi:MAG: FlaD/FlaE family flagellar protein [Archaeoglobaceae archaeon]